MKDQYDTISGLSKGEFRDRGSKFIAYAFPVYQDTEIQEGLELVRKEHPKARHHCYAWRLGLDGNQFRANDDGEPSGTAGRPILGQIDSFGLTNVLIVVVRYFGGTLLGTSGLINAYKQSTADALAEAEVLSKFVEDVLVIHFDYALMSQVMNAVKKLDLLVLKQEFTERGRLEIAFRQSLKEEQLLKLLALVKEVRIEEVDLETTIEGFSFDYLYTR